MKMAKILLMCSIVIGCSNRETVTPMTLQEATDALNNEQVVMKRLVEERTHIIETTDELAASVEELIDSLNKKLKVDTESHVRQNLDTLQGSDNESQDRIAQEIADKREETLAEILKQANLLIEINEGRNNSLADVEKKIDSQEKILRAIEKQREDIIDLRSDR